MRRLDRVEFAIHTRDGNNENNHRNVNVSFLCKDKEMKHFPMKTLKVFDWNEQKLVNDIFKEKVKNALKKNGKFSTISITISQMLECLMTYELGLKFSFKGRKPNVKKAFITTRLYNVVFNAANELYGAEVTVALVNSSMSSWLIYCKTRLKRQEWLAFLYY
ncbi:uncharacterized protein LOC122509724 [Leptopilina heterotoma]|uniref:uncharacterized protein LOC122509724 n=1 Tax=Leptopilina heterotoma TaxID=63436 RepID=UPI001CA80833|nr:uncharacterized protein LOC122509724 [Leptopilina heterotoma]XP_043479890.1 uncharacterized protein LOC122509724 [Leptopilina heterotoma]